MKPNIAFCGFIGTGKTTAAKYLEKTYNYNKIAFADELKIKSFDMLWNLRLAPDSPYTYQMTEYQVLKELGLDALDFPAPTNGTISEDRSECNQEKIEWINANRVWLRPLLQKLAQHYREQDPEYWIKCFDQKYRNSGWATPIVVDDLRFRNEADYLRDIGFRLVYITRSNRYSDGDVSEDLTWIEKVNPTMIFNPEDKLEIFHNDIQRIVHGQV